MSTRNADPAPPAPATAALFDALDIGPITTKNRIVFGPHTTEFGRDNLPTQRHVDYYEERARGGAGLIITESTYVHPSAKSKPNSVLSCDPGCVPVFGRLADAVHGHGTKVIGQLSHRGRQMTSAHSGMPVWGVSPLPCPVNREQPKVIGEPEIAALLDGYATATDHYWQAGYDGVEIHAAHGYLIEQFWSPWTNQRDDAYGGSLDNRIRFSRMVVERVRSRCSDGMAVGMRVSADELVDGGLRVEDVIEILSRLNREAGLDYVSVSIGTHGSSHVMIGDMTVPQGLVVPQAAQIKAALQVPVLVGLRIKEPRMAAGIIEYLAEGAWTKRLHPGWAAQSGIRAADLARQGFVGPRTVFEGTHGLYHGFARSTQGDWAKLVEGFGQRWISQTLAFKVYACGTMTHPYIDCARRLSKKVELEDVVEILCEVAEGTVHRLWEPLAAKQRPPNAYAAKFSQPYCIAAGLVLGHAGLEAFTEERVRDPRLLALAAKVGYEIDPDNPYPEEFTGHVRVVLRDGASVEERQAHFRGGAHEPLSRADLEEKFRLNCAHGGWPRARSEAFLGWAQSAFSGPVDLSLLRPP